jgi:CRISPR system Cascade subunit CasA
MTFDLLSEPWIPVIERSGARREIGLIEMFRRADEISEIRDECPLVTLSIHRLALAIMACSLDGDDESWTKMWDEGFGDDVERYLQSKADRFDLFHPTLPFYQLACLVPAAKRDKGGGIVLSEDGIPIPENDAKPPSWIVVSIESGNTASYVDRRGDAALPKVSPARAARELITWTNYSPALGQSFAVDMPDGTKAQPHGRRDGVLTRGYTILLTGSDLRQTLLLNFGSGWKGRPSWDLSAEERWDMMWDPALHSTAEVVELLTWPSRSAKLIDDGSDVVGVYLNTGLSLDKTAYVHDPMKMYRIPKVDDDEGEGSPKKRKKPKKKSKVNIPTPISPRPGRALWRDFDALLADSDADGSSRRIPPDAIVRLSSPAVCEVVADLPVYASAFGIIFADGRASKAEAIVRSDIPIPPHAEEAESSIRKVLREAAVTADSVCFNMLSMQNRAIARLLGMKMDDEGNGGNEESSAVVRSAGAELQFWFDLDAAFDELLDGSMHGDPDDALDRWDKDVVSAADRMQRRFVDHFGDDIDTRAAFRDIVHASKRLAKRIVARDREGGNTDGQR